MSSYPISYPVAHSVAYAPGRALLGGAGKAVTPYVGPGDIKSGAFAWWGLRAYSAATAGTAAVDIYNTVTTTTQTFNTLANGDLDKASVATFLGGNPGKIAKLWDQTGNGWHVTNATPSKMPDYVPAEPTFGNTRPTMKLLFANSQSLFSAATGLSVTTGTMSMMASRSGNFGNLNGILECAGVGALFNAIDQIGAYQGAVVGGSNAADYTQHAVQQVFNGASSIICTDGTQTTVNPGSTTLGSPFTLGCIGATQNNFLTGTISECGFWSSIFSSTDCANVNANQQNYWMKGTAYEGLVALRCRALQATTDTTNKYLMGRSAHIATEALSAIRVAFPNYQTGATSSLTASIEYPAGTFTQLLFQGSASATVPGGSIFSDYVNVSIPSGATFWVRIFTNNTSGVLYNSWQNTFLGEACALSATAITDQTMSGTITNSGSPSGVSCPPMAILGVTVNPSVVVFGDSIAAGVNDTEDSSASITGYNAKVGVIARSLGSTCFANLAVPGAVAGNPVNVRVASKASHLIGEYGINNLNQGYTSATLITALAALYAYGRPFQKIYQTTITPDTTSGTNWADGTQVPFTNDAARVTFNTALRAATTGLPLTGYIDVASVLESSLNSGKWVFNGTAFYYTGDGLHPSTNGYALVQTTNLIPTPVWP